MSAIHTIYLASAGTGKTYQLSGRFLDLLLAGAQPRRILATTFTRKAAGEILDRILERLVEAVQDADERAAIAKQRVFGATFSEAEALERLGQLVRGLDRFEVRTLDSFFVHLGRLFALDLDLAPQWTIADDHQGARLQEEAIARLLEEVDEEAFVDLLRAIQRDRGAGRSVHRSMGNVVRESRAAFLDSSREAWEFLEVPEAPPEEELAMARSTLEAFQVPRTKAGKANQHWSKAHGAVLQLAAEERWSDILENGLVGKILQGEQRFARIDIPGDYQRAVHVLFGVAAVELIPAVIDRNARTFELLARFEQVLGDVKRERGTYNFEDIPRCLAPADHGAASPIDERGLDLALRLDSRLDHLLLDEFQDTSPAQWRILGPMAEELTADGSGTRSYFCVGDVKQSIYGWRSAEPRLLEAMGPALHVEPSSLHESYRSSSVILDTVDRVFSGIGETPAFEEADKRPQRAAASRFGERFEGHTAALELPGAAELREARAKLEGEGDPDPVLELAVQRVVALARSQPQASIGILLRSNRPIPLLIERLQSEGVRASGEGGNPLVDSAAVLQLLSLLHLADHPSDRLAAFHVSCSPFGRALGFDDPMEQARELARCVRERLVAQGHGGLCASFVEAVEASEDYREWDRRRFHQLVQLAFGYQGQAELRADRFVDLVREKRVDEPASSRVKVMTIHASKGLEFDAVVLPQLDDSIGAGRMQLLTERPEPRAGLARVSTNPGRNVCALVPELLELYEGQVSREAEEALCVLYVGMTRSKHRLELLVRRRSKGDGGASYAGILRSALGSGPADPEGVIWRHPESSESWLPAAQSEPQTVPEIPAAGFELAPTRAARRLPRMTASGQEGGTQRKGSELLGPASSAATRRGSLIHRWMEEIEWLEDFKADAEHLLELGDGIEPDLAARRAALTRFEGYLQQEVTRARLSRPPRERQVWREREFSLVVAGEAGDQLWSGAFDRVELEMEAERVISARILDFKTDAVSAESLDERVALYRPQLEGYRRVLSVMTGLEEASIGVTLLFLSIDREVEL